MFLAGVCLGALLTLAAQWWLGRGRRARPKASVIEFPLAPQAAAEGGFLDSILSGESDDEAEHRLRRNLKVKVFHDEIKVQRLVDDERRRQPDAPLRILLEAAIERWERDNR